MTTHAGTGEVYILGQKVGTAVFTMTLDTGPLEEAVVATIRNVTPSIPALDEPWCDFDRGDEICAYCTGEACARCPGIFKDPPCDHDVTARHP